MTKKIDTESWNAALEAAAALLGKGFTFVRRHYDPKTRSYSTEIFRGDAEVPGDYVDACHCPPDDEEKDVAAILSLRKIK